MHYHELEVCSSLRGAVDAVWSVDSHGAMPSPEAGLVVPDGCVELVVSLDGAALAPARVGGAAPAKANSVAHRALVLGHQASPLRFAYAGPVQLVGLRLRLAAALRLLGSDLASLCGSWCALDDVLPRLARDAEQIGAGASRDAAALRLQESVLAALRRRPPGDARVEQAADLIGARGGCGSIAGLAGELALSPRQLDRRFTHAFGVPPKLFARVVRFARAWEALLTQPESAPSAVALAHGYFDQAHLNRDFRQFAGTTPGRVRAAFGAAVDHA
jgi:AraC-like DNA-binding protein